MVRLQIFRKFDDSRVVDITITDRLTIVGGNSSTGKTHICDMLVKHPRNAFYSIVKNKKDNSVNITLCTSVEEFTEVINNKLLDNTLVVIDEYVASKLAKKPKLAGLMSKTEKYFLIFQRDLIARYNVGINSLYKVVYKNRQYSFEKLLPFNDDYKLGNITKCTKIIMEDSNSGFKIMRKYFNIPNKMEVDTSEGNGNMLTELLKSSNIGKSIIIGLDYDKGGSELAKIKEQISNGALLKDNIYLIKMESFEEIICNSDLIISKSPNILDYIENIEKHMDCSFEHRGDYFNQLIKWFFISKDGKVLYTKHNASCFNRECTECKRDKCKFRNNEIEKIMLLFSRKYNMLLELYKYLNEQE